MDTSPKIPADLVAEVRSVSAIGEQYVELLPRTDSPPYLRGRLGDPDGDTKIPQAVGPMLDQVSTLINSIPKEKLSGLLDESFDAFNGAGYDLGSLFDSSAKIAGDLNKVSDQTTHSDRRLRAASGFAGADDGLAADVGAKPCRDHRSGGGERSAGAHSAAGGAAAADEVSRLLDQVKPTLPVLLANLTTLGQVAVTYHPSLEQVLVLLPPFVG